MIKCPECLEPTQEPLIKTVFIDGEIRDVCKFCYDYYATEGMLEQEAEDE